MGKIRFVLSLFLVIMTVEQFQQRTNLDNLIPCRKVAYENADELKVVLYNGKFWDLLAFYNNQWHYIKTIKK